MTKKKQSTTTESTIPKKRKITSLNSSFFDLLPVEIADLVVDYLSSSDIIECICVASTWTYFFYPKLFQTVELKSSERISNVFDILKESGKQYNNNKRRKRVSTSLSLFSTAASSSSSTRISLSEGGGIPPNLGYNTRHIVLCGGIMSNYTMRTLAQYCPNVQSLVFLWHNENKSPSQQFMTKKYKGHYSNQHKAHSPVPFLKPQNQSLSSSLPFTTSYSNLRSLTLFKSGIRVHLRPSPNDNINITAFSYNVLQNVPQLEHLILKIGAVSLTIQDMEVIHRSCPRLKSLEIDLIFMDNDNNTNNEILSSLVAKEDDSTTAVTITPTTCFEKLVLESDTWGNDESIYNNPWFKYISLKYPGLKHLKMNVNELKDSLYGYNEHIFDPDHAFHFPQRPEQIQRERPPSPTTAKMKLKDYFPQLEHVTLGKFGGKTSITWPQLIQGISSVALRDADYFSVFGATTVSAKAENDFQNWAKQVNLTTSGTMTALLTHHHDHQQQQQQQKTSGLRKLVLRILPLRYMDNFKHFTQLCQLHLDGIYRDMDDFIQTLPVDLLLINCPTLEHLKIKMFLLVCQNNNNSNRSTATTATTITSKSRLHTLLIHESGIVNNNDSNYPHNNVLTRIGQLCPRLVHLDIFQCDWLLLNSNPNHGGYPVIHIDMPHQKFSYLRLVELSAHKSSYAQQFPILMGDRTNTEYGPEAFAADIRLHPSWAPTYVETDGQQIDYILLKKPNMEQQQPEQVTRKKMTKASSLSLVFKLHQTYSMSGNTLEVKRLTNNDNLKRIITWLEKEISTNEEERNCASERASFLKSEYVYPYAKHCSIVIHCQSTHQFYCDDIRLDDMGNDDNHIATRIQRKRSFYRF
ncbi:hypothetical protein BDC45DRAFT_586505 [Circinella umbellata]|nr:hypothetical protein BDC45DRAFT_586505 [Circinella umbellata]